MSPRRQASAFDIRETLDEAVRCLSVSASPLHERVRASGIVILDRLSPTDFAATEDRELFHKISTALGDTSSAGDIAGPTSAGQMSDAIAEEIASDILDLRHTVMGRAIRDARAPAYTGARGKLRR